MKRKFLIRIMSSLLILALILSSGNFSNFAKASDSDKGTVQFYLPYSVKGLSFPKSFNGKTSVLAQTFGDTSADSSDFLNIVSPTSTTVTDSTGTYTYTYTKSFYLSGVDPTLNSNVPDIIQCLMPDGLKIYKVYGKNCSTISRYNDDSIIWMGNVKSNSSVYVSLMPETITLNSNDGNNNTKTITPTSNYLSWDMPSDYGWSRTGYTSNGWVNYNSKDSESAYYGKSEESVETNDFYKYTKESGGEAWNLYACWKPNTYTVNYKETDGSKCCDSITAKYDTSFTLPTPTKTGYYFSGWYSDSSLTTKVGNGGASKSNLTSTNGGTVNLYAKWSPYSYKVTFNAEGGKIPKGANFSGTSTNGWNTEEQAWVNITYGTNTYNKMSDNIPTKTGYNFNGWYTATVGGKQVYNESGICTNDTGYWSDGKWYYASSLDIYAQWSQNNYTIKYNANGGSGEMSSTSATYNEDVTLSTNTFTREGYVFEGWSLNKDDTTATYGDGQVVKNLSSDNNGETTLYAIWKPINYNIIFDSDGGTTYSTYIASYDTPITLPTPTKKGSTFLGWYDEDDNKLGNGGDKISKNFTSVSGDTVTIYAKWELNEYTVSLVSNGGECSVSEYSNYFGSTVTLPTPTKFGYTFDGWWTTRNNNGNKVTENYTIEDDVTLYAHWIENNYTIVYNSNGGSGSMSDQKFTYTVTSSAVTEEAVSVKDTIDITLNKNSFSKIGCKFLGWTSSNSATDVVFEDEYTDKMYDFLIKADEKDMLNDKTINMYALWETLFDYDNTKKNLVIKKFYDGLAEDLISVGANNATSITLDCNADLDVLKEILLDTKGDGAYAFNDLEKVNTTSNCTNLIAKNNALYTKESDTTLALYYVPSQVEEIDIVKNCVKILENAFDTATLTEVELPYSVTTLEKNALNSNSITKVVVKNTDTTFEDESSVTQNAVIHGFTDSSAETYCDKYDRTFVKITELWENFYKGEQFDSYSVPSDVTIIGDSAFKNCTNLESIDLNEVTRIEEQAFNGCTSLESIDLTDIEVIGARAFNGCSSLKSIEIPSSETKITIGTNAFLNCTNLKDVYDYDYDTVYEGKPFGNNVIIHTYYDSTGYDYADTYRNLIELYVGYEEDKTENLENCNADVYKVNIGEYLTSIADSVFEGKENLKEINFTDATNLKTIGESAFADTKITSVSLPSSLEEVGASAFSGCEVLKDVEIKDDTNLKVISANMFNATSISAITLPYNIQKINDGAFVDSALTEVTVENPNLKYNTSVPQTIFPKNTLVKGYTNSTSEILYNTNLREENPIIFESIGKAFIIELNASGGKHADGFVPTVYGINNKPLPDIEIPTREHYTFLGYFTQQDNGEVTEQGVKYYDNEGKGTQILQTAKDFTLYASWKENKYKLNFDANGGEGEIDTMEVGVGEEFNLPKNTFTRKTYVFKGWSTTKDGKVEYKDTEKVKGLGVADGETTLYAVWEKGFYTIVFDANNGSGDKISQSIPTDTNTKLSATHFTNNGYILVGWGRTNNDKEPIFSDEGYVYNFAEANTTTTLYAIWEEDTSLTKYLLKYNANGGVFEDGVSVYGEYLYDGVSVDVSSIIPTRENFVFMGWTDVKGSSEVLYKSGDKIDISEDSVLYAVWETTGDTDYEITTYTQNADGTYESTTEKAKAKLDTELIFVENTDFVVADGYSLNQAKSVLSITIGGDDNIKIYLDRIKGSVKYDTNANGDNVIFEVPFAESVIWGTTVSLSSNMPEREGYTFEGWALNKDSTDAITEVTIDYKGVTVYAIWQKIEPITSESPNPSESEKPSESANPSESPNPSELPNITAEPISTVNPTDELADEKTSATSDINAYTEELLDKINKNENMDDTTKETLKTLISSLHSILLNDIVDADNKDEIEKLLTNYKSVVEQYYSSYDKAKETEEDNNNNNKGNTDNNTDNSSNTVSNNTTNITNVTSGSTVVNKTSTTTSVTTTNTDEINNGIIVYKVISDTTATVYKVLDKSRTSYTIANKVTINGKTYKVTNINAKVFMGCSKVKKVVIGKNVTKIGNKAFFGCKTLKKVIIKSKKLKKVGKKAFTKCHKKLRFKVNKKLKKKYAKLLRKGGVKKVRL